MTQTSHSVVRRSHASFDSNNYRETIVDSGLSGEDAEALARGLDRQARESGALASHDVVVPKRPSPRARRVVNVRHGEDYDLYVGRRNKSYGLPGSKWANPFRLGPGEKTGDAAERFRSWITTGEGRPLLADLHELDEHEVLACWCAPQGGLVADDPRGTLCHAQVLLQLLEQGSEQEEAGRPVVNAPATQKPRWEERPMTTPTTDTTTTTTANNPFRELARRIFDALPEEGALAATLLEERVLDGVRTEEDFSALAGYVTIHRDDEGIEIEAEHLLYARILGALELDGVVHITGDLANNTAEVRRADPRGEEIRVEDLRRAAGLVVEELRLLDGIAELEDLNRRLQERLLAGRHGGVAGYFGPAKGVNPYGAAAASGIPVEEAPNNGFLARLLTGLFKAGRIQEGLRSRGGEAVYVALASLPRNEARAKASRRARGVAS